MTYRTPSALATLLAALVAADAGAAVIVGPATVVANGNGSVSSITFSNAPGNDNQVAGNVNIQVNGKNFTAPGPIDIVFTVSDTGATSEYFVGEGIANNTGVAWPAFEVLLGTGTGAGFVPSVAGDGLDFDYPTFDPAPAGGPLSVVSANEDLLSFTGGSVPNGGSLSLSFSIDVPDGLAGGTFTLRQLPIVPEPGALAAVVGASALLLGRRRRA